MGSLLKDECIRILSSKFFYRIMHHFRRFASFSNLQQYAVLHFASFFVNLSKIGHFQLVNLAHSKLMIVVDSRSCDVEKVHKRLKQFPDFFSVDF